MKAFAILPVFILLVSLAYATDVTANYQNTLPTKGYHFNTDMRLTSDVTFAVASGGVVSGNAAGLQPGDTVCSGATVTSTPAVSAKWAVSSLDVLSMYPEGDLTYTPLMPTGPAVSTNKDIKWLSAATYDKHDAYGDANNFIFNWDDPFAKTMYNELATFYNQPVSYRNTTGTYNNKEGGANVFCKASFTVQDGGTTKGSAAMPSPQPVSFAISGAGQHTLTAGLGGTSCFAAVVKHPLNQQDYPGFFRLYYFSLNQPSIPALSATDTITINVVDGGGTCSIATNSVVVSRSASAAGVSIVKTSVRNNADAILVRSVTSSNSDFNAIPLSQALCTALGFPSSLCPSSNGFNETLNPGANRDLYVIVITSAASGGTVLSFNAETLSAACGASGRCSAIADITQATCTLSPAYLRMLPREIGAYTAACQDLAGASVPCSGSNWAATANLNARFLEADSTHARLYSEATPPVTGTLTYTASSGLNRIVCNSTLDVASDVIGTSATCAFVPPRADMIPDEERYFELHCMLNTTIPRVPDSADYAAVNGLTGTLGNQSTAGTGYTAPAALTFGNLRGIAWFDVRPDVVGAVAFAYINVSNAGVPSSCEMQPDNAALGTGETGDFTVTCRNSAGDVVDCVGSAWAWDGISGEFTAADNTHAIAYPTSAQGSRGLLTYTSGRATCNATVSVTGPAFSCEFVPPAANVDINGTRYFEIQAFDLRGTTPVRITPAGVTYALIDGLLGTHDSDSVTGTRYNAPDSSTSGRLRGAAEVAGGTQVVCFAPINVSPASNAAGCDIAPSSAELGPLEYGKFTVTCRDTTGSVVDCTGSAWAWDGISGGFIASETDNMHAWAYPEADAAVGSVGLLTYTSGAALCNATVTVVDNQTACLFNPPRVGLSRNGSRYFETHAYISGVPATPSLVVYGLIDGLLGSHSNDSVAGTRYEGPDSDTIGRLQGAAEVNSGASSVNPVCLARVNVSGISNAARCDIAPLSAELGPLEYGEFTVTCTDDTGSVVDCTGSAWAWDGISGGFVASETDNTHAWAYPEADAAVGSVGLLTYTSGAALCNATVTVVDNQTACLFNPPRVDLSRNGTRYFETHAYINGTPATPSRAVYGLIDGLDGSHSNDSVAGTLYEGPDLDTIGRLQGAAELNTGSPSVKGAVCLARVNVSGISNAARCDIAPLSAELGPLEYGEFTVTCRDTTGSVVDCTGSAWAWYNISGGFIASETDNTHAWAYPAADAEIGSVGTLSYTSGPATCSAAVTIVPANFSCQFSPPDAKMDTNRERYFTLLCYDLRQVPQLQMTPLAAVYDLIGGLNGSHSNDTVDGTLYASPGYNSSGRLQGAAELDTGSPFVKGAVALAGITVANGTGEPDNPGSSEWCTIFGPGSLYPGFMGWVSIWCGPKANQLCSTVVWGYQSVGVTILGSNTAGANINVTAPAGTEGRITAYVDGDPKRSCYLPFISGERACMDLS